MVRRVLHGLLAQTWFSPANFRVCMPLGQHFEDKQLDLLMVVRWTALRMIQSTQGLRARTGSDMADRQNRRTRRYGPDLT